ncbi:hypothetical protein RW115_12495 [Macrococcus capreoli]
MISLNEELKEQYDLFCEKIYNTDALTEEEKLIIGLVVNVIKENKNELNELAFAAHSRGFSENKLATISALTQILWFENLNTSFDEEDACCQ